jgi:hypothetical protein
MLVLPDDGDYAARARHLRWTGAGTLAMIGGRLTGAGIR